MTVLSTALLAFGCVFGVVLLYAAFGKRFARRWWLLRAGQLRRGIIVNVHGEAAGVDLDRYTVTVRTDENIQGTVDFLSDGNDSPQVGEAVDILLDPRRPAVMMLPSYELGVLGLKRFRRRFKHNA